ncbi:hypothetical protein [uncultured Bacteroides sp.]|uniref:hypothetical protein n=1 Tax=uncultured Bacteroides sp. TaxID=162156 RepID=UPI0025951232|nr:hypothetical protein [uncultured Bacteroides sp.]
MEIDRLSHFFRTMKLFQPLCYYCRRKAVVQPTIGGCTTHYRRLYNRLMAAVVTDRKKSHKLPAEKP